MWDWVIHLDVWEVRPLNMPNRFLIGAPEITPDIWIGLGNQWMYWPLEPPQLQCIWKLKLGEIVTVNDRICWEGYGQITTITKQPLFQAKDSCVYVNATILWDVHFNLATGTGNHVIYWPADKTVQVALWFRVPFNWTALVPNRFHNLLSLLSEVQQISELQGQIHQLQNIYQTEKNAFQTAYRVSTRCTKYDALCFVTKTLQQPQPHRFIVWGAILTLLLISVGFCYCCCKRCFPCCAPTLKIASEQVALIPLRELNCKSPEPQAYEEMRIADGEQATIKEINNLMNIEV